MAFVRSILAVGWVLAALSTAAPARIARAAEDPVEDIVAVLRDKGLIDDATEQQILAKRMRQQAAVAPAVAAGGFQFLDGFTWFGDLRLRNEQFWYDSSFGDEADDRNRFRYRARIGFTKQVSQTLTVGMRLASGADFNSTNETFGGNDDFARDTIAIDQIWAELALPGSETWTHGVAGGKLNNPFLWKNGADRLIWDSDISPEGFYYRAQGALGGGAKLFGTAGYFLVSEESGAKDPKLFALQLGASAPLGSGNEIGARISGYEWRALDDDTIARNLAGAGPTTGGNLAGAFDGRARIAESSAYLKLAKLPGGGLLWTSYARNLLADSTFPQGDEDTALGAGLELGDEKQLARFGAGYMRIEANSILARFGDSDLFDGFTNREGFFVTLSRELASRVLLRVTLFDGEEIRTRAVPAGQGDVAREGGRADRKRLQSDIEIKF